MANYSTKAIIINIRDFGEADKLVTLLSQDKGRIESIAKGARKSTSRKSSQLELLNRGKFSFAKGKNLDIMLEVEVIDNVFSKSQTSSYNYLFYFSELLNKTFQIEENIDDSVWQNLLFFHVNISKHLYLVLLAMQLFVLEHLGVVPSPLECKDCGVDLKESRFLPTEDIGYVCEEHNKNFTSISDRVIKIQSFLINSELKDILRLDINDADFWTILSIQNTWIENFLEKEMKSFQLLYSER